MSSTSRVEQILDLARWAPSGDNAQPWRFEPVDEHHFVIHGHDTRASCLYDLDGRPSQLALGALIETAAIAASAHGLGLKAERRESLPAHLPTFDVSLNEGGASSASPLIAAIPLRRVQRRPLSLRPPSEQDRLALAAAVGPDHELHWFTSWPERIGWASLLWANAGLRLRLPEAFQTHRDAIEWRARFSPERIPDQALGVDALTLSLMRFAMQDWQRLAFMNRWLGGTIAPRLLMDLLPALACAGHIAITARTPPRSIEDHVAAGRAVQRFWLTATQRGLQHQPAITPLVFARYVREGLAFTRQPGLADAAARLSERLAQRLGAKHAHAVWLGRLGFGPPAGARSTRKRLGQLLQDGGAAGGS